MQQYYDNEKQPQSQEQMNMLLVSEEYEGSIRTRLKKNWFGSTKKSQFNLVSTKISLSIGKNK